MDGAPAEVPLDPASPLVREWALIADGTRFSACLFARERPGQTAVADGDRLFEGLWTVEPDVVREGVELALALVAATAPELAKCARDALDEGARPCAEIARSAIALTNRIVGYVVC